jgi:gliding motility-associated-like protein
MPDVINKIQSQRMKLRIQKKMNRIAKRFFSAAFILLLAVGQVDAQCSIATVNPGFELPAIPGVTALVNYTTVPGWITTETDSLIEIWENGFQGVPSYAGNQFIELNAWDSAAIYQDFNTPCPRTINYHFAHRGRLGVDVAQLMAGPPGGPFTVIRVATDGTTWGVYTGTYAVPAGQTVTRFMFVTISTSTGNPSIGNFLDSVNFSAPFTSTHLPTDATCSGQLANPNGQATVFPVGCAPYTYAWNTVPVQSTQTAVGLAPGTYVCTITDVNSCTITDTVTVIAHSGTSLTVNSPTICNGASSTLTASGSGAGALYTWSPSAGLSSTTGTGITANPSTTTVYNVTGISTGGCTSIGTSTVTVNQPASLAISFTNTTTGTNGTATVVATGSGPFSYSWSPSGGNAAVATGLSPATYTVTVTDGNGCQSTASITIVNIGTCTFHPLLTDSYEYLTACPDVISGTTYQTIPANWVAHSGTRSLYLNFVDSVSSNGTNAGDLVYRRSIKTCPGLPVRISTWLTTSFAGLQCNMHLRITDETGNILADTAAISAPYAPIWFQYQSPTLTPSGDTLVFLMYTNVGGGPGNDLSMDDFLVEHCYDDIPSVHINSTICASASPFNLYPLLTDTPAVAGTWSPATLTGGYQGTFNPLTNTSGNYIYTSSPYGTATSCPLGKDTVTMTVLAAPVAAHSITPQQGPPPLDVTFTNQSTGGNSYMWNFGDGTSAMASDTMHTYANGGTYNGSLVVSNGVCADTASFTIQVGDSVSLFIPNVFTPDGDQYNDLWQFRENGFAVINVAIFNRWGNLVHQWSGLNGYWDGKTKGGTLVSDGIYYYVVSAQPSDPGKPMLDYHGSVTLISGKE